MNSNTWKSVAFTLNIITCNVLITTPNDQSILHNNMFLVIPGVPNLRSITYDSLCENK